LALHLRSRHRDGAGRSRLGFLLLGVSAAAADEKSANRDKGEDRYDAGSTSLRQADFSFRKVNHDSDFSVGRSFRRKLGTSYKY
jgi:hypothetical protein